MGCGGLVPVVDAPTHAYMQASPGCWALYGELCAALTTHARASPGVWHHVDCFAVQHPGGAEQDRRQRQSVAVHLISLCLLLELGHPPQRAAERRARISARVLPRVGLAEWPYLSPPADLGAVTVASITSAATSGERAERLDAWPAAAWAAWAAHHDSIRVWASAA